MKKRTTDFDDDFLTTKQIAKALDKSLSTVQRWCREGKVPASRIEGTYIIRRTDFDRWFESKSMLSKRSAKK